MFVFLFYFLLFISFSFLFFFPTMEDESSNWLIPKVLLLSVILSLVIVKGMSLLWWRPRKIEEHFSKQGIRGPPYQFFIGNVKELVGMMLKASSHPMPFSHNILPRVLSFYHHWRKIYGSFFLLSFFFRFR